MTQSRDREHKISKAILCGEGRRKFIAELLVGSWCSGSEFRRGLLLFFFTSFHLFKWTVFGSQMCESGVDLGFDLLEEGYQDDPAFYELKSRIVEPIPR